MTTTLKTSCPCCGKRLRISDSKRGKTVRCPACRETFVASDVSGASQLTVDTTDAAVSVDTAQLAQGQTLNDLVSPAAQNSEEQTLRKLGRFELKSVLGAGGFGKVYRAYDPQLERFVALKVPTFGPNQKTRIARFLAEAKAAARLKHANIVSTFESGKADKKYYIASEYIEGDLLSRRIKKSAFSIQESVELVRKLADALAYAHSRAIVHRDLKPHNIIIDENGEPQLMDFGLAKRLDDDSGVTTDGSLLGTPAYMAPEQARGQLSQVNALSDQYSLGVVLFHMLTGTTPCTGSPHKVVAEVAKGEYYSAKTLNPQVDSDLDAVCRKAMHPDANGRYPSCSQFSADLLAWSEGRLVIARRLTRIDQLIRLSRRHKAAVSIAAAFFTVLTCAVLVSSLLAVRASQAEKQAKKSARMAIAQEQLARAERDRAVAAAEAATEAKMQTAAALRRMNYFLAVAYGKEKRYPEAHRLLKTVAESERRIEWHLAKNELDKSSVTFRGHTGRVYDVCCTPDGRHILSAGDDGSIRIWNAATAIEASALRGHEGAVRCLSISEDGTLLASGGEDQTIRLWDVHTRIQKALITAASPVSTVSIAPSGRFLVYEEVDSEKNTWLKSWDIESEKTLWEASTASSFFSRAIVDPRGRFVLVNSGSRRYLYQAESGEEIWQEKKPEGRYFQCFNHDGTSIFNIAEMVNTKGTLVKKWSAPRLQMWPKTGTGQAFINVWCAASHPRENVFVTGAWNGCIRIYDEKEDKPSAPLPGHESRVTAVCYSPDGNSIYSAGFDGVLKRWDFPQSPDGPSLEGLETRPTTVQFSPMGDHIAAGDTKGNIVTWDTESHQQISVLKAQKNGSSNVAFSPDGTAFAIAGPGERVIEIRDIVSGDLTMTLEGHQQGTDFIRFSPNGKWLASISYRGGTLRLWDADTGNQAWSADRGFAHYPTFCFSPDSSTIAFGQSPLRMRDVTTGKQIPVKFQITSNIMAMCFSLDGSKFATGTSKICVWDAQTGERLNQFASHVVSGLTFTPDGTRIVTTGEYEIKIWDWLSGQELRSIPTGSNPRSIAISPDGHQLAFASPDNDGRSIRILNCRPNTD